MLLEGNRRSYNPLQAKILLRRQAAWFGTLVATFREKGVDSISRALTALLTPLKIETTVASLISINTVSHNTHKRCEQFYYMATSSEPRLAI